MSAYYLEHASVDHVQKHFDFFEEEARCLLSSGLAIPAYVCDIYIIFLLDFILLLAIQYAFCFFSVPASDGMFLPLHARYDQLLKTSHAFNILDSRGFVGVTERARYFGRMRR